MDSDGAERPPILLPATDDLAERLLDAAAGGRFEDELELTERVLAAASGELDPDEHIRYRLLLFDLSLVSTTDQRLQGVSGIQLLAAAQGNAWETIVGTSRIDELRRLTSEPVHGIELLELLTYAPDAGIRDFALSGLEAAGMRMLAAGVNSRSIERLLHAASAQDGAYRLEAARKQRDLSDGTPIGKASPAVTFPYRTIAVAGGHAQMRVAAAAVLKLYGATIVPIPSSREATRRERDILQMLQGCDVVVLLVRQITHSTSDQVRRAAERLGVPVIFSNSLSAVGIERQLLESAD